LKVKTRCFPTYFLKSAAIFNGLNVAEDDVFALRLLSMSQHLMLIEFDISYFFQICDPCEVTCRRILRPPNKLSETFKGQISERI
jgi:hypothetical protein